MSIAYCECEFVTLGIQHAVRMHHTAICCLPNSTQYFSTFSHKRHNFRGKKLLNTKCVFWFSLQLLSETFFILRRIERDMIQNAKWSACEVPFIIVRFWWNLNFLNIYSKNTQMSNCLKIPPVEAEFHADGRTDMKLIVAFRNFANSPKDRPVNVV